MRAILISPATREIKEVNLDPVGPGSIKGFPFLLDGLIEPEIPNRDVMFTSLEEHDNREPAFFILGRRILPGGAILIGENPGDGDTAPAKSTIEEITAAIHWTTRADLLAAKQAGEEASRGAPEGACPVIS